MLTHVVVGPPVLISESEVGRIFLNTYSLSAGGVCSMKPTRACPLSSTHNQAGL